MNIDKIFSIQDNNISSFAIDDVKENIVVLDDKSNITIYNINSQEHN